MRIALFGGTFDPPHRGHIAVAKAAADTFTLDQVLFAPTGLQPLKRGATTTPFAIRLELVAAACESDPRFFVSDIDAPRSDGEPNYTVDALAALRTSRPEDTLFNIVGADAFLKLREWREPERLLDLAEWIVVTRPGYTIQELSLKELNLTSSQRNRVHILSGVQENVSATELRERLYQGDPCDDLLPTEVGLTIRAKHLFRTGARQDRL